MGLKLMALCSLTCLFAVYVCVCSATYEREVRRILAQQPWEDSLSLDTLLILKHVAVHEAIQHGGVGMNINVELQTHPLMKDKGGVREQRDRQRERR